MKKFSSKLKVIAVVFGMLVVPYNTYAIKETKQPSNPVALPTVPKTTDQSTRKPMVHKSREFLKKYAKIEIPKLPTSKATDIQKTIDLIANNTGLTEPERAKNLAKLAIRVRNIATETDTLSLITHWYDKLFSALSAISNKKVQIDTLMDIIQTHTRLHANQIRCNDNSDTVAHLRSLGIDYDRSEMQRDSNHKHCLYNDGIYLYVVTQNDKDSLRKILIF